MTAADFAKALVGFVLGLFAFGLQRYFTRSRKWLIANVSSFSLLSLPEAIRDHVSIQFKGQSVANIITHRVSLLNTGNQVIENHEIALAIAAPAQILHLDPGPRAEVAETSSTRARVKIKFLNPRESTEIRVSATGEIGHGIKIEADGPGVRFMAGERLLPVLEANMTSEEVEKVIHRATLTYIGANWKSMVSVMLITLGVVFGGAYILAYFQTS